MNLNKRKGLSSLLSDADYNETPSLKFQGVEKIDLNLIKVNPNQPRKNFDETQIYELAESIRTHGLIQPITIRLMDNYYELIAGERRLRACKLAGLKEIPAFIKNSNDEDSAIMALVENVQRENLNAIEVAITFERMLNEHSITNEELGVRVGKDRSTVTNYLRLLKLPTEVQKAIVVGKISMGHARALITLDNIQNQKSILKKILDEGLSVRKVEDLVKKIYKKEIIDSSPNSNSELYDYIDDTLNKDEVDFISEVQIKVDKHGGTGTVSISFNNEHDLGRIMSHFEKKSQIIRR
jgi:ParB family transcriptional regulator, chromosome partitioning protein